MGECILVREGGKLLQRVIISMQNYVLGEAVEHSLKTGGDFHVDVVEKPEDVARLCVNLAATAVLMEVTSYTPCRLEERLKIRDEVKRQSPMCKIVLLVDENAEKKAAERVCQAKKDGLIDWFIYEISVQKDAKYKIKDSDGIEWGIEYGYSIDKDDIFEESTSYYVDFFVVPEEGYSFADDITFVHGIDESLISGCFLIKEDDGTYKIQIIFNELYIPDEEINEVSITGLTEPVVGETPSEITAGLVVGDSYKYEVKDAYWYDITDGKRLEGAFKVGHRYVIKINLEPMEGYEFSDNLTATINNIAVGWDGETDDGSIWVYHDFKLSDPDEIETVTINGIEVPETGEKPSVDGISVPEGANYKIDGDSIQWYAYKEAYEPGYYDWIKITNEYEFKDEEQYRIELRVDPNSGYSLAFEEALKVSHGIDKKLLDMWYSYIYEEGMNRYIRIAFKPLGVEIKEITGVAVSGIEEPVAGEKPVILTGWDIGDEEEYEEFLKSFSKYSTSENIKMNILDWVLVEDDELRWDIEVEKFQAGKTYACFVGVISEDGYEFSYEGFNASINGGTATVGDYDKYYGGFYRTFTVTDKKAPDKGGGSSSYKYYTITASAGEGGSISPSGEVSVRENLDKTFTVKTDEGYVISDVLADGKSVGAVKSYTFEDVTKDHTIKASFIKEAKTEPQPEDNLHFTDVNKGDWYYEGVKYAVENGLMVGTSANEFSPNTETTRGMIVTILHRLAGLPEAGAASGFGDIAGDEWYAKAVAWAAENKIVRGFPDGTFGANGSLTREQLVTILYNYSVFKGYKVDGKQALDSFADGAAVSDYAKTAMEWAVSHGIVTGVGENTLSPQSTATRAQMAAILQRYIETITK